MFRNSNSLRTFFIAQLILIGCILSYWIGTHYDQVYNYIYSPETRGGTFAVSFFIVLVYAVTITIVFYKNKSWYSYQSDRIDEQYETIEKLEDKIRDLENPTVVDATKPLLTIPGMIDNCERSVFMNINNGNAFDAKKMMEAKNALNKIYENI